MRESDLIKKIQYILVSKILDGGNQKWHMDDVLSVAIYEMIGERPIMFSGIVTKNHGEEKIYSIKEVYKYLEKNNLLDFKNNYGIEFLGNTIKKKWLLNGFYIIDSIERNGCVVIKEELIQSVYKLGEKMVADNPDMEFFSSKLNCRLRNLNDNEDDEFINGDSSMDKYSDISESEIDDKQNYVEYNEYEIQLNYLWNEIVGDMRDNWMPYVWKLKISQRQYDKLKELLKDAYPENGRSKERLSYINHHALKLLVYCAEWYRREYNGNDNGGNALDVIHIKQQQISQLIYKRCYSINHIFKKFIYERENTLWLYSMYVLGGLPLAYQGQNMSNLCDKIVDLVLDGDNDDICLDDKDLKYVNNTVVKKSLLQEDGSLKLFVDAIINSEIPPIAEEDLTLQHIKDGVEQLKEGREHNLRKKFQLIWMVQYNENIEYRYRWLRLKLKPEIDGSWYGYINAKRLPLWGIKENIDSIQSITLGVRFNKEESVKYLVSYKNNYMGYFVGVTTKEYIDIEDLPNEWIDTVEIVLLCKIEDETKVYLIGEPYSISKYIQMYPTDNYQEWSSKKPIECNKSAVMYKEPVEPLRKDNVIENFSGVNHNRYNWCTFYDDFQIRDENGTLITLIVPYQLQLMIKMFPSIIKYTEEDKLVYKKRNDDTDCKLVQIAFGNEPFYIHYKNKNDKVVSIKNICFKPDGTDYDFQQWNRENKPTIGMNRFRINYNGMKEDRIAYYLPGTLSRDVVNHSVKFYNMDGVIKMIGDNIIKGKDYKYIIQNEDSIKSELLFYLGTEDDFVEVPIYSPCNQTDLIYFDGRFILKNDIGKQFELYPILKEHYNLRKNNYYWPWGKCINEQRNVYKDNNLIELKRDDKIYCNYKLWDEIHENMRIKILEKNIHEYVFYGWNMSYNTDPIQLNTTYDYTSKTLIIQRPSRDYFVFQSLKDPYIPSSYWGIDGILMKELESSELFKKEYFGKHKLELQIKCFEIAMEHNIYCVLFKPLRKLAKLIRLTEDQQRKMALAYTTPESNDLMKFVIQYYQYKGCELNSKECKTIWRMSKELGTNLTIHNLNEQDTLLAKQIMNIYFK